MAQEKSNAGSSFMKFLTKGGVLIATIIMFIIGTFVSDKFFTLNNMVNVARQISIDGIIALAMTFVVITGGVDLSVGSQVAVIGIVVAQILKAGMHPVIAICAGLLIGALFGVLNGLGVTKGKLPPFIMTLGTMTAIRGIALYLSNGAPQNWRNTETNIKFIGQGYLFGIPFPIFIFAAMLLAGWYMLRYTSFGRNIYAVGDNREAARLNGVNVNKTLLISFVMTGAASAIAAIVLTSKLSSADPTAGNGYELNALARCYIGGCSAAGGEGSIIGTLIGCCLLGFLSNIMNLVGVNSYMQQIVEGLIIIIAVLLGTIRRRS